MSETKNTKDTAQEELVNLTELTTDDFRKVINRYAEQKSTLIFKNGSAENANLVASAIFNNSKTVKIFAENMDGSISDKLPDYIDQLTKFLSKPDHKISIILENYDVKDTSPKSNALKYLVHKLCAGFHNQICISVASKEFIDSVKRDISTNGDIVYFITGDSDKFRLQYDHQSKSAFFGFNNTTITSKLIEVFDLGQITCTPVNVK